MKFFCFTQVSNYSHYHWENPYDAPNTPEPFYPKYFPYFILHSQSPINNDPSIFPSISEILFAIVLMSPLLIVLINSELLTYRKLKVLQIYKLA